jgi:hypothetical protein
LMNRLGPCRINLESVLSVNRCLAQKFQQTARVVIYWFGFVSLGTLPRTAAQVALCLSHKGAFSGCRQFGWNIQPANLSGRSLFHFWLIFLFNSFLMSDSIFNLAVFSLTGFRSFASIPRELYRWTEDGFILRW